MMLGAGGAHIRACARYSLCPVFILDDFKIKEWRCGCDGEIHFFGGKVLRNKSTEAGAQGQMIETTHGTEHKGRSIHLAPCFFCVGVETSRCPRCCTWRLFEYCSVLLLWAPSKDCIELPSRPSPQPPKTITLQQLIRVIRSARARRLHT